MQNYWTIDRWYVTAFIMDTFRGNLVVIFLISSFARLPFFSRAFWCLRVSCMLLGWVSAVL
jgi:hypothetical protein